jgi:hypothetical protein
VSEALEVLQDVLDRLSPIHVVMARGLDAKAIERLRDDLVTVEEHLAELEGEDEEDEYEERIVASVEGDATP